MAETKITREQKQLVGIINGLNQSIINDLEINKHSPIFINRINDKIQKIIEYSGELGKMIQYQESQNV